MACDGFGNGHRHIPAGLQPVNEGMPEHVGSEVQVPHGLVQRGGARGVANLLCVLRNQPVTFLPDRTAVQFLGRPK